MERTVYRSSAARRSLKLQEDAYTLLVACARAADQPLTQTLRAAIRVFARKLGVKEEIPA